ncbi:MAG TPA: glycosyltransferase [Solirubrobacterales bacterium]|nr:glycosyltransferase [Solirubrobacterales bacterium]
MPDLHEPAQQASSISQYWDTEVVPDSVADLLVTFRDRNPDFHHCVYSESEAEQFIGKHFGSRELAAFRACAVPSMQSDYFRYCSVLALGGVYADADYVCARSLRPLVDRPGGEIFLGPSTRSINGLRIRMVWSAFFAFSQPGHPFLRLALQIATANLEARIAERIWPKGENVIRAIWLTVGPGIFSLMGLIRDLGSFDAFIEKSIGTHAESFAHLYCEVIGDYGRLVEAFGGVRVSPHESLVTWVRDPQYRLPYKDTDSHWHNVRTAIFR